MGTAIYSTMSSMPKKHPPTIFDDLVVNKIHSRSCVTVEPKIHSARIVRSFEDRIDARCLNTKRNPLPCTKLIFRRLRGRCTPYGMHTYTDNRNPLAQPRSGRQCKSTYISAMTFMQPMRYMYWADFQSRDRKAACDMCSLYGYGGSGVGPLLVVHFRVRPITVDIRC